MKHLKDKNGTGNAAHDPATAVQSAVQVLFGQETNGHFISHTDLLLLWEWKE